MLHGYSHAYTPFGPEYVGGNDLRRKTKVGRTYLERLLDCHIGEMVPPNNSLSRRGAAAVSSERLNVLCAYGYYPWERELTTHMIVGFFRLVAFTFAHGRSKRLTEPLNLGTHKEFYCYGIVPGVGVRLLKEGLRFAVDRGGDACLATHYWELAAHPHLIDTLYEVVTFALEQGMRPVFANELFEES